MRLTWLCSVYFLLPSAFGLTVILDPGHGGYDKGAVYGSAQEAKIVLLLGEKIKQLLEQDKINVFLTRSQDQFISLKQRVQISKKQSGDLFVSLHANASSDRRAYGLEFFLNPNRRSNHFAPLTRTARDITTTETDRNKDDIVELSKAKDIAKILKDIKHNIQSQKSLKLTRSLQQDLPGNIKQAPFYVLTQTQMPSVLIEVGFLSHPQDNKKLMNDEYRNDLALKIADSIKRYTRAIYPPSNLLDENTPTPR
ncbi:MAG: N-acetylmuramoyl-L-alanine amidase [Bdellovibrionaceae bacterium]|nr:N-acetylmuramoyl-L-alanine amidase [Pseudobdellovibrionaceae bacterium]